MSSVDNSQQQRIVLKHCRCKFKGSQPPLVTNEDIILEFNGVTCRVDHKGKPLVALSWEAVTALKFINKPFGLASIFLEISRNSPKGGGLIYLYAEFDNKESGRLEAVLESDKTISKVVRKQDVPVWLYANWFNSGLPAAFYSRQLRLIINFTNIAVQSALLAWIIVSFVSHIDTAFKSAEAKDVPKAVQWFRTVNDPVERWLHSTAWPFVKAHAVWCVPLLAFGSAALLPVVVVAAMLTFGWDLIYHLTVLTFHLLQFNHIIQQVYSNTYQLITLVKYTLVWAANFRKRKPKTE